MNTDLNRRQRRTRRRTGGGACRPWVASIGECARFNRFGRMVDHRWYDSGASTDRDRYTYGYDRASNRLYRENTLTTGKDELYGYDQLNRLVEFARGDLNNPKSAIENPKSAEDWSLDMTGNWPGYVQKTSGTRDLEQGRTHNPVNEITAITATTGTNWADPVHDRAGNMTTIPKPANLADGLTATYDAWSRLVEVKDGQTMIARYDYDGLNRRIKSHIDSGAPSNPTGIDTYVHYYHNSAWQILETRQTDTQSAQPETLQPKHQYVWSQRYIDSPVLRDENTGTNGLCDDQRLYYLNDANFNVTALLDTSGAAVERYVYSPYGVVTICDATWTNTRTESSYANVTLYTGRKLDTETGLYYYRNRYYSAECGRFVSRDPIGDERLDINLYRYCANMPTISTDPDGRFVQLVGGGSLLKVLPIVGGGKVVVVGGVGYAVGYLPGKYVTGPIGGRIGEWWFDAPPLIEPIFEPIQQPVDAPPISQECRKRKTCKTEYPGWHACTDYPYGSTTAVLSATLGSEYTTYQPKRATRCGSGGGTHYLVKRKLIKGKVASILCCNCCKDTPEGPKTSRGCKLIPG